MVGSDAEIQLRGDVESGGEVLGRVHPGFSAAKGGGRQVGAGVGIRSVLFKFWNVAALPLGRKSSINSMRRCPMLIFCRLAINTSVY